jgi:hypothetical protein
LTPSQNPGIKPQLIIPFEIDDITARKIILDWRKKLVWAKKWVKTELVKDLTQNAVFLPYWIFDTDTNSDYKAYSGEYYYVSRERRTKWTKVAGQVDVNFKNFISYGSNNVNYSLLEETEDFNLERAVEFKQTYLSNQLAEIYHKGIDFGWNNAQVTIKKIIKAEVKKLIKGDVVDELIVTPKYSLYSFTLIYLPFYVIGYTYLDEKYQIIINGQNGKIRASHPTSLAKIYFFLMLGVLVFTLIVVLISMGVPSLGY